MQKYQKNQQQIKFYLKDVKFIPKNSNIKPSC